MPKKYLYLLKPLPFSFIHILKKDWLLDVLYLKMFISFKKSLKTSINKLFPLKKALDKFYKQNPLYTDHSNLTVEGSSTALNHFQQEEG